MSINWMPPNDNPQDDNINAAINFLSLVRKPKQAKKMMKKLVDKPIVQFKAKDILRASNLPPLPADDPDVAEKLAMVAAGTPLQPVFLLRGNSGSNRPLQIADGYHRVSAAFHIDPMTEVDAQIIHP